jgi:hypothetical protein
MFINLLLLLEDITLKKKYKTNTKKYFNSLIKKIKIKYMQLI